MPHTRVFCGCAVVAAFKGIAVHRLRLRSQGHRGECDREKKSQPDVLAHDVVIVPYDNFVKLRRSIVVVAILVLVIGISVAIAPQRLPRFILGFAYTGPLVDVAAWQSWVNASPNLFGPLGETAQFGVVDSPDDSTGLVLTRTRDGVVVRKSHILLFRPPPLLLVMNPQTALELRSLTLQDGDRFWDGIKYLVQSRRIVPYVNAPRKELDRVGLTGFLQVIDAIPPER